MKFCCACCSRAFFSLVALLMMTFSLQAQTQVPCDLSKCTPKERAECLKKCSKETNASASLVDFLFASTATEKPACKPAACKKASTTSEAKLVATETEKAPTYGKNVAAEAKKPACKPAACKKAKARL